MQVMSFNIPYEDIRHVKIENIIDVIDAYIETKESSLTEQLPASAKN